MTKLIYVGTRRPVPTKASWADRARASLGTAGHSDINTFIAVYFSQSIGSRHLRSIRNAYSMLTVLKERLENMGVGKYIQVKNIYYNNINEFARRT